MTTRKDSRIVPLYCGRWIFALWWESESNPGLQTLYSHPELVLCRLEGPSLAHSSNSQTGLDPASTGCTCPIFLTSRDMLCGIRVGGRGLCKWGKSVFPICRELGNFWHPISPCQDLHWPMPLPEAGISADPSMGHWEFSAFHPTPHLLARANTDLCFKQRRVPVWRHGALGIPQVLHHFVPPHHPALTCASVWGMSQQAHTWQRGTKQ